MDRDIILATTFAAAFHAALFFAFSSSPAPAAPEQRHVIPLSDFKLPNLPTEDEPIDLPARDARDDPEPPPPALDDFPARPLPHELTTRFTPAPPVEFQSNAPTIVVPQRDPAHGYRRGTTAGVIPADWLDAPPRARVQPAPPYPFEAKRAGLTGQVLVEFTVDENGRVVDPRVIQSTSSAFEESTLRSLTKWRFEPGRRDGRIVRFRMVVPVVFNMHE